MIGIKKNSEYLELLPGTQIQRERSSPIFLEQTETGKDSIPGEISYPFTLPLTDKNLRLLGYPDNLPVVKVKQHDVILEDAGMQLSNGKLVIDSVNSHLNKNNLGSIETHLFSNFSEFWQRVKSKKLSDLSLGGERSFAWSGYSTSTVGFWKHAHDTWAYTGSDDGDYAFTPISVTGYQTENVVTWINGWKEYSGVVELAREENYVSLCPHPYLVYILKQIFNEHGYSIEGDILDDADFKQICIESYRSVNWAVPTINGPYASPVITVAPRDPVLLRLNEHVPPELTVGEFLVELQKLIPISFVINDSARKCTVVLLTTLTNAGAINQTGNFNPSYTLTMDTEVEEKIIGFERTNDDELTYDVTEDEYDYQGEVNSTSDLPTADGSTQNQMYYVRYVNSYWACINSVSIGGTSIYNWLRVGHNVGSYLPEGYTDTIASNFQIIPIQAQNIYGSVWGYFPVSKRLGNWYAVGVDRDLEPWPARLFFHRGKVAFSAGGTMPLATNGIYNHNSAYPLTSSHATVGAWSLSYKVGTGNYGLIDHFWNKWLPVLELGESIKGRLYLKFHEYLQWDWNKVLLINNTPYLIKKISEILPYNGFIDVEAVRLT